jgi:hypothetical protein
VTEPQEPVGKGPPVDVNAVIGSLLTGHRLQLTPLVTPEDAESARRIQEADAGNRRRQDYIRFVVLTGTAVIIGLVCLLIVVGVIGDEDAKQMEWARSILTALVTGGFGYAVGQRTGK